MSTPRTHRSTPAERRTQAQLASAVRWAKEKDRAAATAAARRGFEERFAREVDPNNELSERERAVRAEAARRAHFLRMALKSQQSRRRNKTARVVDGDST